MGSQRRGGLETPGRHDTALQVCVLAAGDWFTWAYQAAVPFGGGAHAVAQGKSAIQSIQGSFLVDF